MTKPQNKTIRNVVKHLEILGLSVYGPNMDVDTGQEFCALMDYSADDVIKRRKYIENDGLWNEDDLS